MRVNTDTMTAAAIQAAYPHFTYAASDEYCFDASTDTIYYDRRTINTPSGCLSLLHEIAHAELSHFDYQTDFELFAMETKAWAKTRELARQHKLDCSDQFVSDCLQSYADWVMQRATCPTCDNFSLQQDPHTYRCFRCQTRWHIRTDAKARIHRVRLMYA